jgi:hypothetical protein
MNMMTDCIRNVLVGVTKDEENCITKSFMSFIPPNFKNDEINENEMGVTCCMREDVRNADKMSVEKS